MVEISSLHHCVISGNSKVITAGCLVESITGTPHSINAFSPEITYDIIIPKSGGRKRQPAMKNCGWQWRV